MSTPLMPKATAIWLIDNTTLTFDQIADYCGLHAIEVQAIADGDIAGGMAPFDPIANGQLTLEEIERCQEDPKARLKGMQVFRIESKKKKAGGKYIPLARRHEKPNGIAWLIKHHPELSDAAIARLLSTTKTTIQSIRDREHRHMASIKAKDPVALGLCTQIDFDKAIGNALVEEEEAKTKVKSKADTKTKKPKAKKKK